MGDLDPGYSFTDNWYRGYDTHNSVLAQNSQEMTLKLMLRQFMYPVVWTVIAVLAAYVLLSKYF